MTDKKRKRAKPVVYHGTGIKPKPAKDKKVCEMRNIVKDRN